MEAILSRGDGLSIKKLSVDQIYLLRKRCSSSFSSKTLFSECSRMILNWKRKSNCLKNENCILNYTTMKTRVYIFLALPSQRNLAKSYCYLSRSLAGTVPVLRTGDASSDVSSRTGGWSRDPDGHPWLESAPAQT